MIGRVVSTKMQKTVVVVVERFKKHPLYKKAFTRSKKFLVEDPLGVKEGDVVEFVKVAPISKNKHWKIVKVVGKSLQEITEEKLKKTAEEVIAEVMPTLPDGGQGGLEEKEQEESQESKVKEEKPKGKGKKNGTAQK